MANVARASIEYEARHVHYVYNEIASHFSSTRRKPWPIAENFLRNLRPGSIGLDVGCGNGKYLAVNKDVFIIACDRSHALVQFACQHQPHSAIVADTIQLPHPDSTFDFALSIAVIHHLSTPERRVEAIRVILCTLRKPLSVSDGGGQALIFVWALEQKDSRRGWDIGDRQDVLVPWVMKAPSTVKQGQSTTYQRYYHLFRQGELESNIVAAGGKVIRRGYERDNWWAIAERESSGVS